MSEPRDTIEDVFGPAWEPVTPKVVATDPFFSGAMDAHNTWFKYLQTDAWKLLGEDGKPRRLTASEAADIVEAVRKLQGI